MAEEIHKIHLKTTFEKITRLTSCTDVLINIPKYHITNCEASLTKYKDGGFRIEIKNLRFDTSESFDMELILGDEIYYVYNFEILERVTQINRTSKSSPLSGTLTVIGYIMALKVNIGGPPKELGDSYFRFVIPADGKHRMQYYLETKKFENEETRNLYGWITLSIEGQDFHMYEDNSKDDAYFIIDSIAPIEFEKFGNICHSIMIGYGLLTAKFLQKEAFYLSSTSLEFSKIERIQYLRLRETLSSIYNPVYSNPYGYTDDNEIVKPLGTKLKVVEPDIFSKLCTKIYTDEEYATLIILLLEANTASLILKPAGYSVALEKLTNMIVEEKGGLKPITDKTLASKLRGELSEVLKSNAEEISRLNKQDSVTILQKNIDKINNPTNRDKLLEPFRMNEIDLSESDIEAIDHRNDFLHGNKIPFNKAEDKTNYLHVFHISLRLNVLINKLIFKQLGYKGWLINYVKRHEKQLGISINEDLFIKI